MKNVIQKSNKMGLYYALGTTGKLLFISIVFLLGAELLVSTWGIEQTIVFRAILVLFFSYMSIGAQIANIPSIAKAKAAAVDVFSIIDEKSTLDVRDTEGHDLKVIQKGKIEFVDVDFRYPTR